MTTGRPVMASMVPVLRAAMLTAWMVGVAALAATPAEAQESRDVTTSTPDGVTVHGTIYEPDARGDRPTVLLFHQGGSNGRAEYEPIVPWLLDLGYRVIAWDQRAGGDVHGQYNRTVEELPEGVADGFCDAYPDLEAALRYASEALEARRVVVWGSSYSAALALQLAARNPADVVGAVAFSPASGGPMADCTADRWLSLLERPAIVFRPESEMAVPSAVAQRERLEEAGVEFVVVERGVHGSSMLVDTRTGAAMADVRERVAAWLGALTEGG